MNDGPQLISSGSLKGILEALAADDNAMCLSGGATLVAMLNTNLIEPSSLIPLKSLTELARKLKWS
jgi:CO/xanthine dehydrogenase FAD-binding subunit